LLKLFEKLKPVQVFSHISRRPGTQKGAGMDRGYIRTNEQVDEGRPGDQATGRKGDYPVLEGNMSLKQY
jgi:hypothetical protein